MCVVKKMACPQVIARIFSSPWKTQKTKQPSQLATESAPGSAIRAAARKIRGRFGPGFSRLRAVNSEFDRVVVSGTGPKAGIPNLPETGSIAYGSTCSGALVSA